MNAGRDLLDLVVAVDRSSWAGEVVDALKAVAGHGTSSRKLSSAAELRDFLDRSDPLPSVSFRTVVVNVEEFALAELNEICSATDESCLVVALHRQVLDLEQTEWVSRAGGVTLRSEVTDGADVDALSMVVLGRPLRPTATVAPRSLPETLAFLSYASEDEVAVRDLHQQLEDERIRCWLDAEEILPGEVWEPAIRRAVGRCSHAIVCLSPRWLEKRGYVQKELDLILEEASRQPEGAIYLIPVRLEPCDLPDRLRAWQSVDLFRPGGFVRLLDALRVPRISTR